MKKSTKYVCSLAVAVIAVALLFALDANKTGAGMLISILQKSAILAVVAVSMNLLNGFTGLFSLGQAGFMSIGAYITAILTIPVKNLDGVYYMSGIAPWLRALKEGMEASPSWLQAIYPFLAMIVGALVAAGFAALIGIPVLRLKSDYLAIATLGFSEIIRAIFSSPQMDQITNGSYGLNKVPTFPSVFGLPSLFTPFIVAAVSIALLVLLINSTYGRAFKAIREDEIAAEAMGINLFRHKEWSFVISSFFTAIAGGLLAMFMRSIEAKTFSITLTYDILLIVVIGGLGSVTGSVLSAFIVTASKEWWLRFFDQPLIIGGWQVPLFRTGFRMVIFSLLLMIVVLFYRQGLMGNKEFTWDGLARFFRKLGKKPAQAKGGAEG
ncbi:branched-chain amino acid ABC transporter permease [bacterium 1XD42-1]|nr:branched-chain amino acid ABC transporter permease [Oscillospiraceae bacterium]RKJ57286.1 branched-chain amino acid ABC transporter permease [bacterium 1XD42-8]RKJ65385.1 branched-chain amino acid ABC transporter permease [bacterium 1XD42-1]